MMQRKQVEAATEAQEMIQTLISFDRIFTYVRAFSEGTNFVFLFIFLYLSLHDLM